MGDAAVGLLENLDGGGFVMRAPVGVVVVLIRIEVTARILGVEAARFANRTVRANEGWRTVLIENGSMLASGPC